MVKVFNKRNISNICLIVIVITVIYFSNVYSQSEENYKKEEYKFKNVEYFESLDSQADKGYRKMDKDKLIEDRKDTKVEVDIKSDNDKKVDIDKKSEDKVKEDKRGEVLNTTKKDKVILDKLVGLGLKFGVDIPTGIFSNNVGVGFPYVGLYGNFGIPSIKELNLGFELGYTHFRESTKTKESNPNVLIDVDFFPIIVNIGYDYRPVEWLSLFPKFNLGLIVENIRSENTQISYSGLLANFNIGFSIDFGFNVYKDLWLIIGYKLDIIFDKTETFVCHLPVFHIRLNF